MGEARRSGSRRPAQLRRPPQPWRRGRSGRSGRPRHQAIDAGTALIAAAVVALLVFAGDGRANVMDAAPPPPGGYAHGAAGSGRNGFGGSIAASPTMRSWPGTGTGANGGPFSFIGAHYGQMWGVPAAANNSLGVGYCVMEDEAGEGSVSLQPDPAAWDAGEMARAAALMSSFGGDRVLPYGIDASGTYDVASGEWQQPSLFGGGEYTRRRHVAVNFGVKMFVEDVSPTGAVAGLKLARDTAVVDGSGGEFSALRNGYVMAQRLATVADAQHAVGGVRLRMVWATADGSPPTEPGTHALEVRASDSTGKPVGHVPVAVLSDIGIDGARTVGATATVDRSGHSVDDTARWNAAEATGWPTMAMATTMASDPRFGLVADPLGADVTDVEGVARFTVTVDSPTWELAFHTQAPTADVALWAGSGIQGQITWTGRPQSASVHVAVAPAVGNVAVRKVIDAADVQGTRDMSGFAFDVTADDGTPIGRVTTGTGGLTPSIGAAAGMYTITEVARPSWAATLGDGGPIVFTHEPGGGDDIREVTYTNIVPAASIVTSARDAGDDDRVIDLADGDATIIDTVTHAALVPGTEYVATGALMLAPPGDAEPAEPAEAGETVAAEMMPTGIVASTTFVPDRPEGDVDVEFSVPADSTLSGRVVVVYQELTVAASGRVIAVHADPDAETQTIRFASIVPPTTTTIPPTTTTTIPTPGATTTTTIPATTTTTIPTPGATTTTTIPPTTSPAATTTAPPSVQPPPTAPTTTSAPTTSRPTTPTTTIPTTTIPTTTTPAPTTTTTSPTTNPATTTTTVPRGARLPRTGGGDGSSSTAITGLALVLAGTGLLLLTTRPRPRRSRP